MPRQALPNNITVPVTAELRNFIEREAERAQRSLAAQVRYLIIRALQEHQQEEPRRKSAA
jgi:hypothetical protein